MEKQYYTPKEIIAMGLYKDLGILYELMGNGTIPAIKLPGLKKNFWRIRKEYIDKLHTGNEKECEFLKEEKSTGLTSATRVKDTKNPQKQLVKNLRKNLLKK
ncbi:MAG: hypothetical protein FWE18_05895 [Alphaproteobacteria bacterium]|nr:hypothetical protein [Alphaproteobacteria bacterium]